MTEQEIYSAMLEKLQEAGLVVDSLQTDGQLHRCGTGKDPHGLDAAYIVHLDPPASLWWQNWQTGMAGTWCAKDGKRLSNEEREALNQRIAEDRRKDKEDRQKRYAEAAQKAEMIWKDATPIEGQGHDYLKKKDVQSYGLRACNGALTVPVYGENGNLQSLQFIRGDGVKRFLTGGKMSGGFFSIPAKDKSKDGTLYIAEGYATAASVHEATGCAVLVAFNAGNLLAVAQMARRRYPERELVLCADYDNPSEQSPQAGGVGVAKATEAARAIGGCLAIPDLDGQKADFNDLAQAKGLEYVRSQIADRKYLSGQVRIEGLHPYAAKVLDEECAKVAGTPEGNRNNQLNRSAFPLGQLVAGGVIPEGIARKKLKEAALSCGLPEQEALATIQSGLVAGMKEPRAIPERKLENMQKLPVPPETCNEGLQSGISGLQVLDTTCKRVVTKNGETCNTDLPDGFYFVEEGLQGQLWYLEQGQNKDGTPKEPTRFFLGPKLEVIAQSRDGQSEGWSKLCCWRDPKGIDHRRLIPMSAIARPDTSTWLAEILAAGGWYPSTTKGVAGLLKRYLLESSPSKFVRQVQRSGWHNNAFIFPSCTIGQVEGEEVFFDGAENTAFAEAGTLEGWQSTIGRLCRGNSRLVFAVSAAFTAILLRPCEAESGGIVFVGDSSTGKTTGLQVGASVWGKGSESGGFLRTWRATANGLEGTASEFSDCLLCLDELGQVDGREIGAITYMLANGQGKSRAKRNGDARKVKNWCSFILSSGEVSVKQMIESAGKKPKAGQDVRLVCVPADAGADMGAFEDLHDAPDAGSFAKTLKQAACENYGHAAKAFIRAFQEHWEDAVESIKKALSAELNKLFPSEDLFKEADGQVLRVATRFLLVALAGESATEWGIVPWEQGDAFNAAKRCFSDWLNERGSVGAAEKEAIIHDVVAFLEQNGQSRFQAWEATEDKVIERVGFRRREDDRPFFYVLPSGFEKICSGHNLGQAKKVLYEQGILIKKEKGSYSYPVVLPTLGQTRCYILTLGGDDAMA